MPVAPQPPDFSIGAVTLEPAVSRLRVLSIATKSNPIDTTRHDALLVADLPQAVATTRHRAILVADFPGGSGNPEIAVTREKALLLGPMPPVSQVSRLRTLSIGTNSARPIVTRMNGLIVGKFPEVVVTPRPVREPAPHFYPPNWQDPIEVEHEWQTDVHVSEVGGSEDRIGGRERPLRRVSARVSSIDLNYDGNPEDRHALEQANLLMSLARRARTEDPFPLYCDETIIEDPLPASSTFLPCDTSYRHFFIGGRALVWSPWVGGGSTRSFRNNISYLTIHQVLPDGLLVSALPQETSRHAHVYPLIDAEISLSNSLDMMASKFSTSELNALESSGPQTLPGADSRLGTTIQFWEGLPVFAIRPEWSNGFDMSIDREGAQNNVGGAYFTRPTEPDRARYSFTATGLTRLGAWDILRFFDRSRGRLNQFWMPSPLKDPFLIYAADATSMVIHEMADIEGARAALKAIAFELSTGGVLVRSVKSITSSIGFVPIWTVTFDDLNLPSVSSSVFSNITFCHRVRFENDRLKMRWFTPYLAQTSFKMVEVFDETDKSVPYLHS